MFGRVIGALSHGVKAIGKYAWEGAKFIGKYHHHIAPLAHGVAMASGNQTAQKYTGAALALSNAVSVKQGLNAGNAKIADAMRANGGKPGVFNHDTGVLHTR